MRVHRLVRFVGCLAALGCSPSNSAPESGSGLAGAGGAVDAPNAAGNGQVATGGTGVGGASAGGRHDPGAAGAGNLGGGGLNAGGRANANGGSGAAGSSGNASAGSSGAAGTSNTDGFTLLFRDEFDSLDLGRWQLMTHSWDGNLALFSESAVTVQSGELRIALRPAPAGTADPDGALKSFLGAEVRSRQTVKHGRVRARTRFARGSAVVSSLVTIYTPWPADDWNELDIECLGKDPSHTQFNTMVYTGPPVTPPVTTSVTPTQEPALVDLGFDPSADFHVYTIEWTPQGMRFLVDDVVRHTWSTHLELLGLPQNVLMTIWASSSSDWAGPVSDATGSAVASYDWLELYEYAAP
jgi:endo-1,3-1,4-beta-glycanase ExoK